MKRIFNFITALFSIATGCSQNTPATIVEVTGLCDTSNYYLVFEDELLLPSVRELSQPVFWKEVMSLPPDSALLNIAASRVILDKVALADWDTLTDTQKEDIRDSIRCEYYLQDDAKIYLTSGKRDFYALREVIPSINRGVQIFEADSTDPFYAQSILLIESPNKLQKSEVGAYGSFQLMKSVARSQGLTVNRYIDERKDFDKSAHAAASLIRNVCIPATNRILNKQGLCPAPDELWYKLLVLHVYHAGATNVWRAVNKIAPEEGSMDLITTLWQTKVGAFGNASQNYSQVALASLMKLHDIMLSESDYLHECSPL